MKCTGREIGDGAGCIRRLKRIKHEPLSPPAYHSEDEESSLSDSEDEESSTETSSRICVTKAMIAGGREETIETSSMTMKREFTNDATKDNIATNDTDEATCERLSRIGNIPVDDQNDNVSPEVCLTSLTPPLDTTQAIESEPTTPPYTDRYTQNNRDHLHLHHHHHSYRRPSFNRDRCVELKLSEHQREHLSLIIRSIQEGNYEKFSELLGRKRDSIKNLLNVFVNGQTALHYSLIYGRSLDWCKQLIMNGANPNQTNKAGWHPIHLASYSCCPKTMQYLLDHFAEW